MLVYRDIISIEKIVSFANVFFISNALLGILAAIKLFKEKYIGISAVILSVIFVMLLFLSEIWLISIVVIMFIFTAYSSITRDKKEKIEIEVERDQPYE